MNRGSLERPHAICFNKFNHYSQPDSYESGDPLTNINKLMGRQFEIVSFRCLYASESGEAL
ncbi:hypothetical protein P3T73_03575 [Kiritimatiellota bacterium B12222]|nr:hypothetical protein P3T73_03575 [Kiritimatiellota bacterium B12222]